MKVLRLPLASLALVVVFCLTNLKSSVSYEAPYNVPTVDESAVGLEDFSPNGLVAEITSCPGWRLSQYKAAESFLLDGIAEQYRGVSVLYIDDGRDPVMVVKQQQTGIEQQRIQLQHYASLEELRHLMEEKLGFQKRTKDEFRAYKKRQEEIQKIKDVENEKRVYDRDFAVSKKKDEIAARVLKMMEDNLKKQQEAKVTERDRDRD